MSIPEESESLAGTLVRCTSMLFDFGAESGVWKSPAAFIRQALPFDNLFGNSLPIPDMDHQLHHVFWRQSTESEDAYRILRSWNLWKTTSTLQTTSSHISIHWHSSLATSAGATASA